MLRAGRSFAHLRVGTVALCALLVACGGGEPAAPPARVLTSILLSPRDTMLRTGAAATYTALTLDQDGRPLPGQSLAWSSSSPAVAAIAGGVVTAISPGTTTIAATSGSVTATTLLTVIPVVTTVRVTPSPDTVIAGQTRQLAVTLLDASGASVTGREVAWSTSDASKATVSATGAVSGIAPGTVTITARSEGQSGTATVVIRRVPVAGVTITPGSLTLGSGSTAALSVSLRDSVGGPLTDRAVTWSTSNAAVAAVSPAGVVTGVSAGTAIVTASSEGKAGSVDVTVNDATVPFVAGLRIDPLTVYVSSLERPVSIAVNAGDRGGSGVVAVTVTATSPAAVTRSCSTGAPSTGSPQDGTWSCQLTVPGNTPSGVWSVQVAVVDAAGNQVVLGRQALEQAQLPGSFTVSADPDAPMVRTVDMDPDTIDVRVAAGQVTVSSLVEDTGSGVARYDVIATAPDGQTKVACTSTAGPTAGTAASGTWSCRLEFPVSSPGGRYGVSVLATDAAQNRFIVLAGTITVVTH